MVVPYAAIMGSLFGVFIETLMVLLFWWAVSGLQSTNNPQLRLLDYCTVDPMGKFWCLYFGIYIFILISIDLLAGTSYLR